MPHPPILIAGGGIGGLAAALALARHGRSTIVLEKRDDAREAGAGIQLGPNAVHALRYCGVAERLSSEAAAPERIHVRDGESGRTLARLPLGNLIASRHGATYWTVHRQDLHAALAAVAKSRAEITIVDGFNVTVVTEAATGIEAIDTMGRRQFGAAMIGADGIGSIIRRTLHGPLPL